MSEWGHLQEGARLRGGMSLLCPSLPREESKETDNRGLCNECFPILFQRRKEEADVGSAIQNILN